MGRCAIQIVMVCVCACVVKFSRFQILLILHILILVFLSPVFGGLFQKKGPAGSGKSTYCYAMQQHADTLRGPRRRRIHVANLDPAAEQFGYELAFDIRDLISVEEVMEEIGLGPNGTPETVPVLKTRLI